MRQISANEDMQSQLRCLARVVASGIAAAVVESRNFCPLPLLENPGRYRWSSTSICFCSWPTIS